MNKFFLNKRNKNSIYYLDNLAKLIIKFDLIKFKNAQIKDNHAIENSKQIIENIMNVIDFKLNDDTLFIKIQKVNFH